MNSEFGIYEFFRIFYHTPSIRFEGSDIPNVCTKFEFFVGSGEQLTRYYYLIQPTKILKNPAPFEF